MTNYVCVLILQHVQSDASGVAKKSSSHRAGYLSLLVNQVWREQWCCVYKGSLHFYHEKGDPRTSMPSLPLHGCEVVPGLGPKHPFAFRILRNSTEVAALEVKRRHLIFDFTLFLICKLL